jgi:hypothetical protein
MQEKEEGGVLFGLLLLVLKSGEGEPVDEEHRGRGGWRASPCLIW